MNKQEILDKMQILKKVTEESYIIPDGNNYRKVCIEIRDVVLESYDSGEISEEDFKEITLEFDDIFNYVNDVRERAIKRYGSDFQNYKLN